MKHLIISLTLSEAKVHIYSRTTAKLKPPETIQFLPTHFFLFRSRFYWQFLLTFNGTIHCLHYNKNSSNKLRMVCYSWKLEIRFRQWTNYDVEKTRMDGNVTANGMSWKWFSFGSHRHCLNAKRQVHTNSNVRLQLVCVSTRGFTLRSRNSIAMTEKKTEENNEKIGKREKSFETRKCDTISLTAQTSKLEKTPKSQPH